MKTLEFALNGIKEEEIGKPHMNTGEIIKPGTIVNCGDCGKPSKVVSYGWVGMATIVTDVCSNCYKIPFEPPFKKCKDDKCKVHAHFDEEEHYNREKDIHEFQKIVMEVLEKVDPKTDSIMELDRISEIIWHYIWDGKLPSGHECKKQDFQFFIDEAFRDYVGLKGRITKLEPLK